MDWVLSLSRAGLFDILFLHLQTYTRVGGVRYYLLSNIHIYCIETSWNGGHILFGESLSAQDSRQDYNIRNTSRYIRVR
jgi:hypothetical protein